QYLRLPGVPQAVVGARLTSEFAASLASRAIDPSNPETAFQLVLVAIAGCCAALWMLGSRAQPLAGGMTVAAIIVDLRLSGFTFPPLATISDLRPQAPDFLRATEQEPFRVLTVPRADKQVSLYPNRMMTLGVQEANGYSSLPPDRQQSYLTTV